MSLRGSTAALALRPAIVAPSAAATERVLWLAAIDRCLRVRHADTARVLAAHRDLRRLIDRHAPSLYAQAPVDEAIESLWIVEARGALMEGSASERAAVMLWAAVGAWTDKPEGRWAALADAGTVLGEALDVGLDARATGRVATKLRAVMAATWAREAGRRRREPRLLTIRRTTGAPTTHMRPSR